MKRVAPILILLVLGLCLKAQQKPLTTLFMTNPFAINPALAGTHNYFQVISNNRFQWVGFDNAPITNTLSIFGPTVNYPMGWGGTISYDVAGAVSIGSAHGSYAYYYPVNEDLKVSMGLNLGILQYSIDMTKITLQNTADPVYYSAQETRYLPDASVGFYLYSSTYNVGFVATNLLNNKVKIGEDPSGKSRLKSHYYLTGGYKYFINREWSIEPTFILKKVFPSPFQLDINVRGWYRNMVWFGTSYRTGEALSILAGYVYENKIQIGYAYDIVLSPLGKYNFGSHELILSYKFNRIKD
ncbi:MAG: type IX secretion system membrane protein PorP/SprF [Bacteroidales bacterium]